MTPASGTCCNPDQASALTYRAVQRHIYMLARIHNCHAVSPELYSQLLQGAGFEQLALREVPHEMSHQGREGREWLGLWRRRSA